MFSVFFFFNNDDGQVLIFLFGQGNWTCILIHNYKILFEKYWWP